VYSTSTAFFKRQATQTKKKKILVVLIGRGVESGNATQSALYKVRSKAQEFYDPGEQNLIALLSVLRLQSTNCQCLKGPERLDALQSANIE
jgi:hypothetical protein